MVTYTTDAGEEIEIPEDPQRIVILGMSYFGNLMHMDANVAPKTYMYMVQTGAGGTEIIYQGLDVKVPEAVQDEVVETGWKKISAEEIEKYAGDYMFVDEIKIGRCHG